MQIKGLHRILCPQRAAWWVAERPEFLGFAKFVDIRALAGPGDASQEDRAIVRRVERIIFMPRQTDQYTVRCNRTCECLFIRPNLRGNDVDIMETRRQHTDV